MSWQAKALAVVGTWSKPPDFPAKVALGLAILVGIITWTGGARRILAIDGLGDSPDEALHSRRRFLAMTAFAAALLSIAYVSSYLWGGPRIIDATTYFLQGRALSHGDLSWTPLEPSASFRGRFLVYDESAGTLGGLFPPGYPLVLALGFLVGAPMIVGPLLAAAIVIATYWLARVLAEEHCPDFAEPVARLAAIVSVICGALRYHTADTMSHGACALGVTLTLLAALRGRVGLAGLALGWVIATRPVSALPIGLVTAWLCRRSVRWLVLGMLPGALLLALSQKAVTGAWLTSTQRLYYATSDGPPGCFRWGFGKEVGCTFEHGDFVRDRLPHGYGIVEALGTTLRRLRPHLLDVANLEPLALLVLIPLSRAKTRGVRIASALIGLHVLAYLPFYFDGNYPGGGARLYADVLGVEHALLALAVGCIVRSNAHRFVWVASGTVALSFVGFAIHGSYEHVKLRERDSGPMWNPDVLTHASLKTGLVFVETDHGFALGHDPAARPATGVVVARVRNDARDRMLYDALNQPPTYLYKIDTAPRPTPTLATLVPWTPPPPGLTYRFEAEAEWPPLSQEGGEAVPVWGNGCASGARALSLTPRDHARTSIALPVPSPGVWSVTVHVLHDLAHHGKATLTLGNKHWQWDHGDGCEALPAQEVELAPPYMRVTLEATLAPVALDSFELRKVN